MTLGLINRNSGESLYSQISRFLEADIKERLSPGDFLPSEQELASYFSVNRHTVRRAIDELVLAGLVERLHGKGTMVLAPAFDYCIEQKTRFTESLASRGKSTDSKVLRKLVIPATGGVSKKLKIKEGTEVVWIETLRLVEGAPFCVISHFLPLNQAIEVNTYYNGGSLHAFIKRKLGVELNRKSSLITAMLPQGDDARHLNMPTNSPVLRVKSVNCNKVTGVPLEYAITRFRADRIQLEVNL